MRRSRLSHALADGAVSLPDAGDIAVIGAPAGADLSDLPKARVRLVQGARPDHDAWAAQGFDVSPALPESAGAAVVFVPRAKDLARARVAQAVVLTGGGPVIVNGQKTDGVDSLFKALRARGTVSAAVAQEHGKCFAFSATPEALADWLPVRRTVAGGFVTAPGVFSADGPDRASALLADSVGRLSGRVADLGAGWGYLAARVLEAQPAITALDLVEADFDALSCARDNVKDPRAAFHWADVSRFDGLGCNAVLTNPPFHAGRAADPSLGVAFLRTAARLLVPSGQLWLVANRHLPYERDLAAQFQTVSEEGGDSGFKVLLAQRPKTVRRGR
ncbi:16S rRNA m(2)G 1207 methyltransferase [Rhodovulum imhoffii]|uniref:16S rRNA m(2)G 1207 methyltransferase n=1 Tax=Rhodovulum imhoffii TaxID=365340 RepID=A0A2T5BPJ1_9RHOB|nr:class I SAM-dependent methyltransferase [Rhodovulum imhoffii]MBK5932618.1 hypothetical protein [Rhodovulum imhoffii]PTN00928.1 16S rRNA m(2)G 1207 methyltransferase [Rhodovulum imhoffii]